MSDCHKPARIIPSLRATEQRTGADGAVAEDAPIALRTEDQETMHGMRWADPATRPHAHPAPVRLLQGITMFNPENLPVLIDICSGGGLAAKGLRRAGFFTIGIDHKRKHYAGDVFIQMDVIQFLNLFLEGKILQGVNVSAFWGSVPCQGYSNATRANSRWVSYSQGKDTPKLIEPVRKLFLETGLPYVLENVEGAREHLVNPKLLCGKMFDVHPRRHRLFETNFEIEMPVHKSCRGWDSTYAKEHGLDIRDMAVAGKSRRKGSVDLWRKFMDANEDHSSVEITEGIHPAYAQYVGEWLIRQVRRNSEQPNTASSRLMVRTGILSAVVNQSVVS